MLLQSVHPSGRNASTARDSQRWLHGALGTSAVSTSLRCLLGRMIETRRWRRLQTASFRSVSVPRLQQLGRFALFPDPQPLPSHYRKSVGPLGSTRKAAGRVPRLGRFRPQFLIDMLDFLECRARIFDGRYVAVGCNSTSSQHNTLVGAPIITA